MEAQEGEGGGELLVGTLQLQLSTHVTGAGSGGGLSMQGRAGQGRMGECNGRGKGEDLVKVRWPRGEGREKEEKGEGKKGMRGL